MLATAAGYTNLNQPNDQGAGSAAGANPAVGTSSAATAGQRVWLADGVLLLTATVWGINILVFKAVDPGQDLFTFNALRLVLALSTLVVLALAELYFLPKARPQHPIPWMQVIAFSLLNGLLYLLIFVKAVPMTTAGNIALILASLPMWTALMSKFAFHERLPTITWFGLGITFVGTVIVTTQSSRAVDLGSQYLTGNLLMLVATIAWAGATVASRPIMKSLTPLQLASISSCLTVPIHLLIAAGGLSRGIEALQNSRSYLLAVIYSGVFSTGIAYATWNAGVRMVGASHASVFQNVVTLVAVIGGWLALNEPMLPAQIVGGLLTVAGLFLMRRGR